MVGSPGLNRFGGSAFGVDVFFRIGFITACETGVNYRRVVRSWRS